MIQPSWQPDHAPLPYRWKDRVHREVRPRAASNCTWCRNPTRRTGRPQAFVHAHRPAPGRPLWQFKKWWGRGAAGRTPSQADSTRPPEGAKSPTPIRGLEHPRDRSTRWQQRPACGSCGPSVPQTEETLLVLRPLPSQPCAAGTLASPTPLQAAVRSVSKPTSSGGPQTSPAPLMGLMGRCLQEALEGTDRSKRKKGSGSAGVLPSSSLASLPSWVPDRGHTLTHLGHCSCCLLLPGKPQQPTPAACPLGCKRRGLTGPLRDTRHHNLSGPPTACKHLSSTVHEGDPSLLWPQPHHTHMFT